MSKAREQRASGKAVLYLRVSSEEQVANFSLATQEEICIREAGNRGIAVDRVFKEEGRSAKNIDGRPQLLEMMDYCRKNKKDISTIIVYRIDRMARQAADYLSIRSQMQRIGIEIVSATEPTGVSPTEKLIETMLAGFAQLDNDVRSERTANGLKARFMAGLPITRVPLGYINHLGHASKDPESFEFMREAWQMMASGAHTLRSISDFLNSKQVGVHKNGIRYKVRPQTLSGVFRSKFYCGMLESKNYGEAKGQHEAMISEQVYYAVQNVLNGRSPSHGERVARTYDNVEFPLRRQMKCGICGQAMTGSLSKGKNRKYGYYYCTKRCGLPSSIPTKVANQELEQLMEGETFSKQQVRAIVEMLRKKYTENMKKVEYGAVKAAHQIDTLKGKRQKIVEKNLEGIFSNEVFQEQMGIIEKQIAEAHQLLKQKQLKAYDIDALCGFVENKLSNIQETYINGDMRVKKILLCSVFPSGLRWMYPGLQNTQYSPQWQQIKDIAKSYVLYGDA